MPNRIIYILYIIALLALVPEGRTQVLSANSRPDILNDVTIVQNLDEQMPLDLRFKNEAGEEIRLGDYLGDKPVILSLVYYECPMLCGMILNGLLKSLIELEFDVGQEFEVLTISFDPNETPDLASKKKAGYIHKYARDGAASGWHFLTGEESSIRSLTETVGFKYKYVPETQEFVHASAIMVLTPEGKLSRYFYGIDYDPRDLKFGLMEAADNEIGSPVDQVLLYCFHYDPTTGKYGVVVMNVIRIAGALTVLALVLFIIIMVRRDRRTKQQLSRI